MNRATLGGFAALLLLAATPALANGYPGSGRAIDQLHPAADYSDIATGRPLALGIMRARANGFVPSAQLHDYVRGVLARLLRGVNLPPTFNPDVRVLAAPEFSALCTPDGTIVITIGLLEQLDNEDELAFILGHEVAHAIYRHHDKDWYKKSQYYAVISGAAIQNVADVSSRIGLGGIDTGNLNRGLDVASHLAKLSANVLAPQMSQSQEDAADALGFDLMVRAGYDSEAALAVMDKLSEQEAEAAAEVRAEKEAERDNKHGGGAGLFGNIVGAVGNAMSGNWTDVAIFAFDTAVDNMSDEALSHHPAPERRTLIRRAPRRDRAPRARRRLGLDGVVAHDVGIVDRRQLVGRNIDALRVRGRFHLDAPRLAFGKRALRARALHGPRGERVVRDQLGAGLTRDAARAAEVIGM